MKALLRAVLRLVARVLSRAAESIRSFVDRTEAAPTPPAGWIEGRVSGEPDPGHRTPRRRAPSEPPEHWARKARSTPPRHWLERVEEKAPGLAADLETEHGGTAGESGGEGRTVGRGSAVADRTAGSEGPSRPPAREETGSGREPVSDRGRAAADDRDRGSRPGPTRREPREPSSPSDSGDAERGRPPEPPTDGGSASSEGPDATSAPAAASRRPGTGGTATRPDGRSPPDARLPLRPDGSSSWRADGTDTPAPTTRVEGSPGPDIPFRDRRVGRPEGRPGATYPRTGEATPAPGPPVPGPGRDEDPWPSLLDDFPREDAPSLPWRLLKEQRRRRRLERERRGRWNG